MILAGMHTKKRAVSLFPAATEILFYLGLGKQIFGRSHGCIYPPSIQSIPAVTSHRIDPETPTLVAQGVTVENLKKGRGVWKFEIDHIISAEPDVIFAPRKNSLLLPSLDELRHAWPTGRRPFPELIHLTTKSLEDVWSQIQQVADIMDSSDSAPPLIENFKLRLKEIARRNKANQSKPKVVNLLWDDPISIFGNWIPDMVEIAGGRSYEGIKDSFLTYVSAEELHAFDPDYILFHPVDYTFETTCKAVALSMEKLDWKNLRAVKNGNFYWVDGANYFTNAGPRVVETTELLAEILHPDKFNFGYKGNGWKPIPL